MKNPPQKWYHELNDTEKRGYLEIALREAISPIMNKERGIGKKAINKAVKILIAFLLD